MTSQTEVQRRPWRGRVASPAVLALLILGVISVALCTLAARSADAAGPPRITGEVEPPTTVRQCQKKFGTKNAHERSVRAKCIKRVEHELAIAPGTSCKHPLEVSQSLEGPNGGKHYVKVTLTGGTWHWEVVSPDVEICPRGITFEVISRLPNGGEEFEHPREVRQLPVSRKGSYTNTVPGPNTDNNNLKIKAWFIRPPKK